MGVAIAAMLASSFAFTGHTTYLKKRGIKPTLHRTNDSLKTRERIDTALISPHPQLSAKIYTLALHGYQKLVEGKKITRRLLTIVDFSKPSTEKRLFVINMETGKLVLNSLVAHGRNSGENIASRFSNANGTHQSSLGFYITGSTYTGSNGYSLKLKGLEPGFNDKAENRAIVMHGAPYVCEEVIRNTGRLGRSWGCPAVSLKEHKQIIDLVKGGSCLFIYAPQQQYLASSPLLADINPRGSSL